MRIWSGESATTPPVLTLPASTEVIEAARLLRLSPHGALPVLDAHGRCLGMLTIRAAAEALTRLDSTTDTAPVAAGDLAQANSSPLASCTGSQGCCHD
ncbi:CBS domain-containing protein [Streptomyces sp. NBC_01481]|uniref:CBS domain-containing protein n=1 Tax=Streptomyces sp. NBC_01481 TaxID=2975869 RepID=UPI00338EF3B8